MVVEVIAKQVKRGLNEDCSEFNAHCLFRWFNQSRRINFKKSGEKSMLDKQVNRGLGEDF
jgi:hypothetical protein